MSKFKGLVLLSIFLYLFLTTNSFASIHKSWELIKENKYDDAYKLCEEIVKNESNEKFDALVLMVILNDIKYDYKENVKIFYQLFDTNVDINPFYATIFSLNTINSIPIYEKNELIEFLQFALESNKLNSKNQAWTLEHISRHYFYNNNTAQGIKFGKNIGGIYKWQALGTFENISESGFEGNDEVVDHAETEYVFKNKNNASIKWFDLIEPYEGNWINLQNYFITDNSIIFAQTFCKSPSKRKAQFRIGTSGSIKVWVNDQLVISESEERNNGIDTYKSYINLEQGYNRILLQIGSSEINNSNFFARITDLDGNPTTDLVYSKTYNKYPKKDGENISIISSETEDYFKNSINNNPQNINNYFLLSSYFVINGKASQASELLDKANEIAPDCDLLKYNWLAVYNVLNNKIGYSKIYEQLKESKMKIPLILKELFNDALTKEDFVEAEKQINNIDSFLMNKSTIFNLKIALYLKKGEYEKTMRLIQEAYDAYPYDYDVFRMKILYEKEVLKNLNSTINIAKDYLDKYRNFNVFSLLLNLYLEDGNYDNFVTLANDFYESNPSDLYSLYQLGNFNFGRSQYDKASNYFSKCIEIAPYVSNYHFVLGNALKEMDMVDEARNEYERALELNSYNYDARKVLRIIQDKKTAFEYFTTPNIREIYKENKDKYLNSDNNAAILYEEVQRVIYKGSAYEEKNFLLIQVLTLDGIDSFKQYYIPNDNNQEYRIDKAEVLKNNGNIIKAEFEDNEIVFTNLEIGDVISIEYTLRNYSIGSLSKYFWDKQFFEYSYPLNIKKFKMLVPKDEAFEYIYHNADIKPIVEDVDIWKKYTWTVSDKENRKNEDYATSYNEQTESLEFSSIPNWNTINEWYFNLYNSKTKSTFETNQVIKKIFPFGVPLDTLETLKEIYKYVVKEIRYSYVPFRQSGLIPQRAADVINTKIGDCKDVSTLFVALCKDVGINCNIALVSTRDFGRDYLNLPSILFNHVIATIDVKGTTYYIELTSDYLPFGTLSYGILGSQILEINPHKKTDIKQLYPENRPLSRVERTSTLKVNSNYILKSVNTIKTANDAASMRSSYRELNEDEKKVKMSKAIGRDVNNITLNHLKFDDNLFSIHDTLSYSYGYIMNDPFINIGNMKSFVIPFSDKENPMEVLTTENRLYDFDLWYMFETDIYSEKLSIELPSDMELVEIPNNIMMNKDFAEYKLTFEKLENRIEVSRILMFKKDYIPKTQFKEFKEFMNSIIKHDKPQLLLKSKT